MKNPLLDKEFLKQLDERNNKEVFIKLIALTFNEDPVEEITGRATSGSITVDGKSAVRRSCSINLIAENININEYYWGLNTKFKVYTGLKNDINEEYPEIIWFKQGTYVINSFSTSQNVNSYSISISGKDKMCLLNGELGGVIGSLTHDFGTIRIEQEDGYDIIEKVPIKDTIREVVATYAHEPYYNIIINDLDEMGLELLEFRGDGYLYMIIDSTSGEYIVENMSIDGEQGGYFLNPDLTQEVRLNGTLVGGPANFPFVYDTRIKLDRGNLGSLLPTPVYIRDPDNPGKVKQLTISRFSYGDTCGYRLTDLVYAGDFIGNVGDSITSACLDKIVNMLGNFEYFYDLDGRFIFQRKKTQVNTSWNNIVENEGEKFVTSAADTSSCVYHFEDGKLISSYQNKPEYENLKNDFSIWGEKKSVSKNGKGIPIHLRYAIDKKPTYYRTYNGNIYSTGEVPTYSDWVNSLIAQSKAEIIAEFFPLVPEESIDTLLFDKLLTERVKKKKMGIKNEEDYKKYTRGNLDWREIIYQMALDYNKYCNKDDFRATIAENNREYYPKGVTGYEQYYIDILGFWRTLYDPNLEEYAIPSEPNLSITDYYQWDENNKTMEHLTLADVTEMKTPDKNLDYFLVRNNSYTQMIHYDPDKTYYKNSTAINLEGAFDCGEDSYYTYDGKDFNRSAQTTTLESTQDDEGNSKVVYALKAGETYFKYLGYARVDTGFTIGTTYYLKKNSLSESEMRWIRECDKIGDYAKRDTKLYKFGISSSRNVTYYTYNESQEKYEKASIFVAGVTYYALENQTYIPKIYFDPNEKYYIFNGFLPVYDLTNINPKNIYYYLNDMGNKVPITDLNIIPVGVEVKQYEEIKEENISNGKYFTGKDLESMTEEYVLKYFKRNEQYAIVDPSIPPYIEYAVPFNPQYVYYIYLNGAYIPQINITSFDTSCDYYIKTGEDYILYEGTFKKDLSYFLKDGDDYIPAFVTLSTYDPNEEYYIYGPTYKIFTHAYNPSLVYYLKDEVGNFNVCHISNFERNKTYFIKQDTYKTINIYNFKELNKPIYLSGGFNPTTFWKLDAENPSELLFWFDFLDSSGELEKYSVPVVGDRPKAVNDTDVKSIYYKETPEVVFVKAENWDKEKDKTAGYAYVRINDAMENLFSISSKGKSATTQLDTFLYENTYCTESITISSIPIYYLEPNTRIFVEDKRSRISGEYLISRFTLPLSYNGTMSISATKAVERLY